MITDTSLHFVVDKETRHVKFANITRVDQPTRTFVNVQGESHLVHVRERPKFTAKGLFNKDELSLLRAMLVAAAIAYSPTGLPQDSINATIIEGKVEEPSQAHLTCSAEVTFESKKVFDRFYSAAGEITIPEPSPYVPPPPAPDPFGPKPDWEEDDERIFDKTFDQTFN